MISLIRFAADRQKTEIDQWRLYGRALAGKEELDRQKSLWPSEAGRVCHHLID